MVADMLWSIAKIGVQERGLVEVQKPPFILCVLAMCRPICCPVLTERILLCTRYLMPGSNMLYAAATRLWGCVRSCQVSYYTCLRSPYAVPSTDNVY
eukprot:3631164-Rhodomonas_salina.6